MCWGFRVRELRCGLSVIAPRCNKVRVVVRNRGDTIRIRVKVKARVREYHVVASLLFNQYISSILS